MEQRPAEHQRGRAEGLGGSGRRGASTFRDGEVRAQRSAGALGKRRSIRRDPALPSNSPGRARHGADRFARTRALPQPRADLARVQPPRAARGAGRPRTPLLERVKFLAIVSANLDEFFMKRIGGLKQQVGAGVHEPDRRRPHAAAADRRVLRRDRASSSASSARVLRRAAATLLRRARHRARAVRRTSTADAADAAARATTSTTSSRWSRRWRWTRRTRSRSSRTCR